MFAQAFNIFDQQCRVIVFEPPAGPRQTRTALVVHNEIVDSGIVEAPRGSIYACTRSAMQIEHRQPFRIAAFLEVEVIALSEVDSAPVADWLSIIERVVYLCIMRALFGRLVKQRSQIQP